MVIAKQKWTVEEEAALRAGVAKHGTGKWKHIQKDPEFNDLLKSRSNIDIKDKWRNMMVSEKSKTLKEQSNNDAAEVPMSIEEASGSSSPVEVDPTPTDDQTYVLSNCLLAGKNHSKYNAMIHQALATLNEPNGSDVGSIVGFIKKKLEVPMNFRKLLSSRLRRLVAQNKLEKVKNCYRLLKEVAPNDPIENPEDINGHLGGTLEEAAVIAAYKVAEAENKSLVASETTKEYERLSSMVEHNEACLLVASQIYKKCNILHPSQTVMVKW